MRVLLFIILVFCAYMLAHNFLFLAYLKIIALFAKTQNKKVGSVNKITIIMPVFNEEDQIVEKMNNVNEGLSGLDVSYEVLIGSDGSEDSTPDIVEKYIKENGLSSWHLHRFENKGKGQTINKLVAIAEGDLIISTDADTLMEKGAMQRIVDKFEADENLGCLSSVPVFRAKKLGLQYAYWNLEMKIRDAESKIGKLIVVTGWLYAYRKEFFKNIPEMAMADDLWVPLSIMLKGAGSEHDMSLKCYSERTDEATEVKRRKRVIAGGADIVKRLFKEIVMLPSLFFVVFSHKINRWLIPFWIVLFGIVSILLYPKIILLYLVLTAGLVIVLTPKRFYYLMMSLMSPVFSVDKMSGDKDLSKWGHTRVKNKL